MGINAKKEELCSRKSLVNSKITKALLSSTIALLCYSVTFNYHNELKESPKSSVNTNIRDIVVQSPSSFEAVNVESSSRRLKALGIVSSDRNAPSLAWLMSFPASGASFLRSAIQASTHRSIASNYGNSFMHPNGEIVHDQYASIPIYSDRPNGPFLFSELPLPESYALVDTHCGGHCTDCYPGRYLMGPNQFKKECLTAAKFDPEKARNSPGIDPFEYKVYDVRQVQKAIHLVRNPYDNIISRFNQEYKLANSKGNKAFTKSYPYNSAGFHKWCEYQGKKFKKEEAESHDMWNVHLPESVFEKSQFVPCHAEFYKFVQWHNNAFFVTDDSMKLDTMMVHYEDFFHDKQRALHDVTDFLEQDVDNDGINFFYHTYDYFTMEERRQIRDYIKLIANPLTWQAVERYFVDVTEEAS